MDVKEKYVMQKVNRKENSICQNCIHHNLCIAENNQPCFECNRFIDAHGVTVQKWIPVTERLPKLIPCSAGTAYSEAVNVLTTGRKVLTAIYDGNDFIADAEFWDAEGEEITHWTPVLFPLPESPKEGNL